MLSVFESAPTTQLLKLSAESRREPLQVALSLTVTVLSSRASLNVNTRSCSIATPLVLSGGTILLSVGEVRSMTGTVTLSVVLSVVVLSVVVVWLSVGSELPVAQEIVRAGSSPSARSRMQRAKRDVFFISGHSSGGGIDRTSNAVDVFSRQCAQFFENKCIRCPTTSLNSNIKSRNNCIKKHQYATKGGCGRQRGRIEGVG